MLLLAFLTFRHFFEHTIRDAASDAAAPQNLLHFIHQYYFIYL
jgi:hypothetical protein